MMYLADDFTVWVIPPAGFILSLPSAHAAGYAERHPECIVFYAELVNTPGI